VDGGFVVNKELEKIALENKRDYNAMMFEKDFKSMHIPTIDRLIKINGHYEVIDCNCYWCKLGNK
jgi:hypothetical protein